MARHSFIVFLVFQSSRSLFVIVYLLVPLVGECLLLCCFACVSVRVVCCLTFFVGFCHAVRSQCNCFIVVSVLWSCHAVCLYCFAYCSFCLWDLGSGVGGLFYRFQDFWMFLIYFWQFYFSEFQTAIRIRIQLYVRHDKRFDPRQQD